MAAGAGSQARSFVPSFVSDTQALLSDDQRLQAQKMDIKIAGSGEVLDQQEEEGERVEMQIGMGLYDVTNPEFEAKNAHLFDALPKSTEQIVKVKGDEKEQEQSQLE
mmetsp:Transcript_10054/g.15338  ORF Transcript_10054/g.15338 Transcript_10054/m.15338 type:complete len:107 (+) Transcript_10054:134-454(+)|eukprot:CAMPEP_0170501772 /NCGR_PEP_ID=MMETSP0208-20121228/39391_1 /TAXON_ID=197538 /ORGANISM="Strombidium inclinatum, Strain S3" /LENGTH=106 /DNA_ID=CAMNT_0010780483 /DNA_START=91 /DNA_END=411 /DNA_ORIENTATION=-